jgi:uncharacterized protein YggE
MKLVFASALSLSLCLATGLFTRQARAADDSLAIPHIAVTGTAVTQVPPNEMKWRLQIETKGPEVEAVAKEHLQNVASLLQFLRSQDIAERELQSSSMQLRENRENFIPRGQSVGYVASTEVVFTAKKLEAYNTLWTGIAQQKNASVSGVEFETSDRIRLQEETRLSALRAARTKAEKMAAELGARLGEPLAIEEIVPEWFNPAANSSNIVRSSGGSEGPNEDIAVGTVAIRQKVKVVFRLISK